MKYPSENAIYKQLDKKKKFWSSAKRFVLDRCV